MLTLAISSVVIAIAIVFYFDQRRPVPPAEPPAGKPRY
jgi:Tfp pilus assembly protein PilW